jgi:hypothetical protein
MGEVGDTTDPLGGTCGPSSPTHDPSPPPPPPLLPLSIGHTSHLIYSSTYNLHSCTLAEFNGGRQRVLNDS